MHAKQGDDSVRRGLSQPEVPDMMRLTKMIQRGEIYPVLNDTKWAELRSEMLAAPPEQAPQFRARSVFAPSHFCTAWDGEFYHHMQPVADIEWLELRASSSEWLRNTLHKHNIPYSIENGVVRVWGYTRPGLLPKWQ